MKKAEVLAHWAKLPPNQPVRPEPVPYKHKGSTYDECGIRITGTPEFIDSVLSRFKDLLGYESTETRLQVVYQETKDRKTGQPTGSYSAYVQVCERGPEAKMMGAFLAGIKG
jgi:hypothetical protein